NVYFSSTRPDGARAKHTQPDTLHVAMAGRAERRLAVDQFRPRSRRDDATVTQQRGLQSTPAEIRVGRSVGEIADAVVEKQFCGGGRAAVRPEGGKGESGEA